MSCSIPFQIFQLIHLYSNIPILTGSSLHAIACAHHFNHHITPSPQTSSILVCTFHTKGEPTRIGFRFGLPKRPPHLILQCWPPTASTTVYLTPHIRIQVPADHFNVRSKPNVTVPVVHRLMHHHLVPALHPRAPSNPRPDPNVR